MALKSCTLVGRRWTEGYRHAIAWPGCVVMVWDLKEPGGRMFHTRRDADIRADRFDLDGNRECARLLRAAAERAWPGRPCAQHHDVDDEDVVDDAVWDEDDDDEWFDPAPVA